MSIAAPSARSSWLGEGRTLRTTGESAANGMAAVSYRSQAATPKLLPATAKPERPGRPGPFHDHRPDLATAYLLSGAGARELLAGRGAAGAAPVVVEALGSGLNSAICLSWSVVIDSLNCSGLPSMA